MNGRTHDAGHSGLLVVHALQALSPDEAAAADALLSSCEQCREEFDALRSTVDSLGAWPSADPFPSPTALWGRLARRIGADETITSPDPLWADPAWEEVAPGISVKILATDADASRVSMLVRLEPDTNYPPHTHAGIEELHLLDGELWINDRELFPGDYSRAVDGTVDHRVWSPTGCTCLLVTSPKDVLHSPK